MKLFCYGSGVDANKPFDTIICVSSYSEEEAQTKLIDLVGSKAEQFELYDIVNE